jgi:hypothetical protein
MFPEASWVNRPVAATGPIAGMDPMVVNPNFPATEPVEQLRESLACVADTAASANSVMRRGATLFDRMLGFTEPPNGFGRHSTISKYHKS